MKSRDFTALSTRSPPCVVHRKQGRELGDRHLSNVGLPVAASGQLNAPLSVTGYGSDRVLEDDGGLPGQDVALFGPAIAADQLWFRKVQNHLEVSIIGTSDKLTVSDWYLDDRYRVEQFKTADNQTLLSSQVDSLVQAMAAFSPPPSGQTALTPAQQSALSPVIAANWN